MRGEPLLAPLREAPEETALVFDVDGTLAPIVPRPEEATVPEKTRAALARLIGRYLLVACVSGREREDARRLVGVDGVEFVGNHGLDLEPQAAEFAAALARFRDEIGERAEDKVLSLSYHYRDASDPDAVRRQLERVAARAREAGFVTRWGRKVLEVRPPVAADKGTAIRELLRRSSARRGLYAGDDTTDLDAFRGLAEAGLDVAVRLAVASPEGPAELRDTADLVVDSPAALTDVLRTL